jgi:hypothetical protein
MRHDGFIKRLTNSRASVFKFAEYLSSRGHTVEVDPISWPKDPTKFADFQDGGDIFIVTRRRLEVKHLGVNFTCKEDWPFKNEVLVSNKDAVCRAMAKGNLSGYVCFSKDMNYFIFIPASTKDHWYLTEKFSKNTGKVEEYYACDVSHVTFTKYQITEEGNEK